MKKGIKITFNSPIILTFVLLCLLATLLNQLTGGYSNTLLFMTYHSSLTSPLTYVRFFTHVLGHSGWTHFAGNATYLLLLGPILEEKYGWKHILEVILITAFITGLVNYIFFPNVALCGASGVVFALILLVSFGGARRREIPVTFILIAIIFLGQQVIDGITVADNVSNLSHILGGITGSVLGYKLNK